MATFYKNDANNFLAALQVETPAPAGYQALDANTSDGAVEKHVPVVEVEHEGRLIKVTVGSRRTTVSRCIISSPVRVPWRSSPAALRPVRCTPTATFMDCGRRSSRLFAINGCGRVAFGRPFFA